MCNKNFENLLTNKDFMAKIKLTRAFFHCEKNVSKGSHYFPRKKKKKLGDLLAGFQNFLWHFLQLLEYKSMIRSHFARGVSEQGDMHKRQFPKDGVRRVDKEGTYELLHEKTCFLHMQKQSRRSAAW